MLCHFESDHATHAVADQYDVADTLGAGTQSNEIAYDSSVYATVVERHRPHPPDLGEARQCSGGRRALAGG